MMVRVIAYAKANPRKAAGWAFAMLALVGVTVSSEGRDLIVRALPIVFGG